MQSDIERTGEVQVLQASQLPVQDQRQQTLSCGESRDVKDGELKSATTIASTTTIILSPPTFWFDEDIKKDE